jgi:hypothetical protein
MTTEKRRIAGIDFDVEPVWDESLKKWYDQVMPAIYPCPQCALLAKVSPCYLFYKDSLAVDCLKCGKFEWDGKEAKPLNVRSY